MLLQSGVVIPWSNTQLVPLINNVMFRKSGRMKWVRHAAQIGGGDNSDQPVPGIPYGKSKFGRAENRWENILLTLNIPRGVL